MIGNDTPAWSPDGTTIAFTSFRHGRGDIYAVRPDGRGETRLTSHPAHDDHAAWSPDGTRIAFVSSRNGNPEIYVMNRDGSDQRRVTRTPSREYYPSWSPDGSRIVFQTDRDGLPAIWVVGADGSGETRLTAGRASDTRPAWSPDGRIAFTSNRLGTVKIHLMNGDGSEQRVFAQTASHLAEHEPSWSSDASRIAFVSLRDPPLGNTEIYVVNADGSAPVRVTSYWGRDVAPSWSPDGRWLALTRGPSAFRPEVHVVRVDGTALRRITSTAVRFDVLRIVRTPVRPVAGRRFTLRAVVSEPTGDVVEQATVACRASLGGRVLRAAVNRFTPSLVTCAWDVPAAARGKSIRVGFDVRAGRSGAARTLRLAVR